jgi:hypothetical protein
MQKNPAGENGAFVYCISYVPLMLKAKGKLIWKNCKPNSPQITMPLLFAFAKEDDEFIQEEEKKLRQQTEMLPAIPFTVGQQQFCIQVYFVETLIFLQHFKAFSSNN